VSRRETACVAGNPAGHCRGTTTARREEPTEVSTSLPTTVAPSQPHQIPAPRQPTHPCQATHERQLNDRGHSMRHTSIRAPQPTPLRHQAHISASGGSRHPPSRRGPLRTLPEGIGSARYGHAVADQTDNQATAQALPARRLHATTIHSCDRLRWTIPAASYSALRGSVPKATRMWDTAHGGLPRAAPCLAGFDTADSDSPPRVWRRPNRLRVSVGGAHARV
jgi:hypothetical protein